MARGMYTRDDGGGGGTRTSSEGSDLATAIAEAQAFNDSWRNAVTEIATQIASQRDTAVAQIGVAKTGALTAIAAAVALAIGSIRKSADSQALNRPPNYDPDKHEPQ